MAAIIYKLSSYFQKQSRAKKMFLKISENSLEIIFVGVSFLIKLQGWSR